MKTAFLIFAIMTLSRAEEIPLPQGPGTLIDQLGSQALVEDNYRDTTAWTVKELSADQTGPVEEINQAPRYVTERMTAPPRVLTEQIRNEPQVITETIEAPIRQKIITQPTVLNMEVKAEPEFFKQDDRTVNRPAVYLPATFRTERVEKTVDVPGNKVINQTFIQPVQKTIREELQIENVPELRKELEPQYLKEQYQNSESVKNVQVPANTIYTQDEIQPVYYRENVQVNVAESEPQTFNRGPMNLPPQFRDRYRIQNIPIFGKTVYNQRVVQPVVTNVKQQVQLQRAPTRYINQQPQVLAPTRRRTSYRNIVPVAHNIPQYVNVPIATPVVHHVPEYIDKFIRYEVKQKDDTYRNVNNVRLNVSDLTGGAGSYNKGPGHFSKNYQKIDVNMSSSDDYHGHRRRGGYGQRQHGDHDHHHYDGHDHYNRRRFRDQDYDISDLYHQQI